MNYPDYHRIDSSEHRPPCPKPSLSGKCLRAIMFLLCPSVIESCSIAIFSLSYPEHGRRIETPQQFAQ